MRVFLMYNSIIEIDVFIQYNSWVVIQIRELTKTIKLKGFIIINSLALFNIDHCIK